MRSLRRFSVSVLGLALSACAGQETAVIEVPLFDASHTPDVLTEARTIDHPPSMAGNRFLKGWWPWTRGGPLALVPVGPVARLEGVSLERRERELVLEARFRGRQAIRGAQVRVAGRHLVGIARVRRRIEVRLPADLPLGRFTMDFEVDPGPRIGFTRAAFSSALPAGMAELEGSDLRQSGYSLVEVVHRVRGGETLVGEFSPPDSAGDEQQFELIVERSDDKRSGVSSEAVFSWRGSERDRLGRARPVVYPVERAGLVRVRFLARGEGDPAMWRGFGFRRGAPAPVAPELAAPAVAAPAAPRLVVLYVMDALRADHVGHLGGPEGISPTLDRLAAAGATFTDHLSVAPNTVPSMKTMFSGQMFLLQGGRKLPNEVRTLAERFADSGYATALLTSNGNVSTWRGMAQGFSYQPRKLRVAWSPRYKDAHYSDNAERVHAAALAWLDELEPGERGFLHLQTVHPHNPYDPPDRFRARYTGGSESTIDGETQTLLSIRRQELAVNEADRERLRGLYAASVAYNDAELDRFLADLSQRYAPGEILLVVTSDHGEELFEHGGVLHGYTLYGEQLRVPMTFWWPGEIAPRRIEGATDSLDLHRTLVELIEPEEPQAMAGRSLWPLLVGPGEGGGDDEGAGKELRFAAASSVGGGIFMVRSQRYKLIWAPREGPRWGQGQGLGRGYEAVSLYDLVEDPGERTNLAGDGLLEEAWLRSRLLSWVELGKRLEQGEPLEEMDEETRRSLEALGYLD